MDEERMRPAHWLGLVLCVSFLQCFDTYWLAGRTPACNKAFPERMQKDKEKPGKAAVKEKQ